MRSYGFGGRKGWILVCCAQKSIAILQFMLSGSCCGRILAGEVVRCWSIPVGEWKRMKSFE